jgi:hypothetical protein
MTDRILPTKSRFSRLNIRQSIPAVCICVFLSLFYRPAIAGPEDDLGVMFRGDKNLPPPGGIAGTVTNKSAQDYPCVDLVFRLIYKGGASGPIEQRVRVQNLSPRAVKNYSAPLQSKAGFALQRIETCTSVSAGTPPNPNPERDCTIKGSVTSTLGFEGIGDTGQREKIERVFLLTPDGKKVSEEPLSNITNHVTDHRNGKTYDSRAFDFVRVPANHSYVVQLSNAWKTAPSSLTVRCPDPQGRYEFEIAPLEHTGNRLGG